MVSGICIFIRSVIHLRHAAWNRVCRLKHSARCWDTLRSRSPWIGTCICPWVLNKARSPSSSSRIRNRKPVKISVRQSGKCWKMRKIWMTCLRKEDSKISFLLIYAIGFYLEPKKQDIWKIFLFPHISLFLLSCLSYFIFSPRFSYNVLLYSLGETLYFSLNSRLKVLWLSKPLSSQIVVIGSLVVSSRCFA